MPYKRHNKRKSSDSRIRKVVKSELRKVQEVKNFDDANTISSITASSSSGWTGQLAVVEGSTEVNRQGTKISVKGFRYRDLITASQPCILRILFIQFPDTNNSAGTDMNAFSTAINALSPTSFLPRHLSVKYRVLMDKCYRLDPDSYNNIIIKRSLKLSNSLNYDADGSIGKGDIRLFYITDNTTSSALTSSANSRLYFTDS